MRQSELKIQSTGVPEVTRGALAARIIDTANAHTQWILIYCKDEYEKRNYLRCALKQLSRREKLRAEQGDALVLTNKSVLCFSCPDDIPDCESFDFHRWLNVPSVSRRGLTEWEAMQMASRLAVKDGVYSNCSVTIIARKKAKGRHVEV